MAEDFEDIKKEIKEKNELLDELDKCEKQDVNKIRNIKMELDRLLYVYYKYLTRNSGLKAFL